MLNVNKHILGGRIGSDVEVKQTINGTAVCTIRLAVQRAREKDANGDKITDWFSVTAWRNTAEFLGKYAHKGDEVLVIGSTRIREYDRRDGTKATECEMMVDDVLAINNKAQDTATNAPATAYGHTAQDYEEVQGDETLPF